MSRFADQLPINTEPNGANFLLATNASDPKALERIPVTSIKPTSQQLVLNLGVVPNGLTVLATATLAFIYLLTSLQSTCETRIRIYYSNAYRQADLSRASLIPISGDHGCYLDAITRIENGLQRNLAPPVIGVMSDYAYLSITNISGVEQNIDLTFNYLPLED